MMKTKAGLEALGVSVTIDLSLNPDLKGFDLVHIFNVQSSEQSVQQIRNARTFRIPVALSPIYWDKRHIDRDVNTFRFHRNKYVRMAAKLNSRIPEYYFNRLSPKRRKINNQILELLDYSDVLLPNSVAELEILAVLFNRACLRARSEIVVNGIDFNSAIDGSSSELQVDSEGEYVLQVGRIEPIKGQDRLIKAMMSEKQIPLVFVGGNLDSPYGDFCKQLANEHGNATFVSHIPQTELVSIYRRAKVHALPSLRESPGLATLEAAAHGANCVVSIHAPVQEYFAGKAWICDPLDSVSIRNSVMNAWQSSRTGDLGKFVLENFTWEKAAKQTLNAYENLMLRYN